MGARRLGRAIVGIGVSLLVGALLAPGIALAQTPTTTTSQPSANSIVLGQTLTDGATVAGGVIPPDGTVAFSVCGPTATGCPSGGVTFDAAETLTPGVTDSTATSAGFTPNAAGTWCFRADYTPSDSTVNDPSSDGSSDECFTVTQASSAASSSPASASIALGASNTDTVTVTGNSAGGSPTGLVNFFVCAVGVSPCTSGGTQVGSAVALTAGAGATATATSSASIPSEPGTYCFRAEYSGDSNYSASTDATSDGCFTVTQASSTSSSSPTSATVALGASNTDTVTVTGNGAGGSPTGTVEFFVCAPGVSPCASGGSPVGSAVAVSAGAANTATATSDAFTAALPGTYCFRAEYSGDSNYLASNDGTGDECFTVTPASSSTASAPANSSETFGQSNTDTVTVTGNGTGGSPTGSVTFFECGPSASSCNSGGVAVGSSVTLSPGAGNTATATSSPFLPNRPGTYCFEAVYGGDSNYLSSSDGSSDECFTVAQVTSSTSSAPQSPSIPLAGSGNSDNATVFGGAAAGSPAGTISFFVCGPLASASGCASGGTAVGSAVTVTAGSGNSATASSSIFTPVAVGTYCFRAAYSGSVDYTTSSDSSADECFTVTQASSSTGSSPQLVTVKLGQPNVDTATVTGDPGDGAPTGTVSFYECGPGASSCSGSGTPVGAAATLTGSSADTATATSAGFTANALGSYCFAAVYSGDPTYASSNDGSSDECFTVTQASSQTASSPHAASVGLGASNTDTATVSGNGAGGSPTGTVEFFVCAVGVSPCASGGTQVGSPVALAGGAGNTATATSGAFAPGAPGTYCFRAEYSGDTNYLASNDDTGDECFTVPQPNAPSASIVSPGANAVFALNEAVPANYGCSEGSGGPGLASCHGPVSNGSSIDTSSLGVHTFTVTAQSSDGESTPASVNYTVAAPPIATISSPTNHAVYTLGQLVRVGVSCADGQYGSGLVSCVSASAVNTNSLGTYTFTLTATSADGQHTTTSVTYQVVAPTNHFQVVHPVPHLGGQLTFNLSIPGGGKLGIVATAPRTDMLTPRPGKIVFANLVLQSPSKTTLKVTLKPSRAGRSLLAHHRKTVKLTLAVTFTPINGKSRTVTVTGLQVTP